LKQPNLLNRTRFGYTVKVYERNHLQPTGTVGLVFILCWQSGVKMFIFSTDNLFS